MDNNLKREIILDNYQNPRHFGNTDDPKYIKVNMNSTSCIDELNILLKVNDNDVIEDIMFNGEACAISTSSASIMTQLLLGKSKTEAMEIIDNFLNMIYEEEYDEDKLDEALVYDDIKKQPNRKKCATLSWLGAKKALEGDTDGK